MFLWHGQFMVFPPADMVAMINANIGEGPRLFIGVAEILAAAALYLASNEAGFVHGITLPVDGGYLAT